MSLDARPSIGCATNSRLIITLELSHFSSELNYFLTMSTRISYSRDILLRLRNSTLNASPFVTHSYPQPIQSSKRKRGKRAGWQSALSCTTPQKMTVPSLVSTNIRSLFGKVADLRNLLHTRIHSNNCIICVQESWLNSDIEDSLVCPEGYICFRQDREKCCKKTGGGVATFLNISWCGKSNVIFAYSYKGIDCLTLSCSPKFSSFCSTIVTNLYIAPFCSQSDISIFLDSFIPFMVPLLTESLFIIVGDFNHASTYPLTTFGLKDLSTSPTRGNTILDRVITNHPDLFSLSLKAPVSTSDHCLLLLRPKIYSSPAFRSFTQSKQIRITHRNFSPHNLSLLNRSLNEVVPIFSFNSSISSVDLFTDVVNAIFNLCCPKETLFLHKGRIASPLLKSLRRRKEVAYKSHNSSEVRLLSREIKHEIRRLNSSFAEKLLGSKNGNLVWQGIRLICGQRKTSKFNGVDIDELNAAFIHPSSDTLTSYIPLGYSEVQPFSSEEIFRLLRTSKSKSSAGPDGLSPALLKYGAGPLTEVMKSIINESVNVCSIPNVWRPVTVVPIPKTSTCNILSKRFRPIAITSSALKLAERAILSRLRACINVPHDPFQFAYKTNRSTLDAVSSVVHFVAKSLDQSMKSVRCIFLDYSSAFDSVPRCSLLHKLESFGCPTHILSWLKDYFTNRVQRTKMGNNLSCPLMNNSGVLQGAVLSPYLFSTYISDLFVPSPAKLIKYADDVVLCQSISDQSDFLSLSDNLASTYNFSMQSGLHLNSSKCFECLFTLSRSSYPSESSLINGSQIRRVDTVKYLGVILQNDLRWSSHILSTVGKLRRLSFQIRKLRQFTAQQSLISSFVNQCVLPIVLYCSPVIFPGLLKKDFIVLRRGLAIISRVSLLPMESLISELCDQHIDSCESFAHKILSDHLHPLHSELSVCHSHPSTRSAFRLIPARINLYKNSPVPYLARVLTDKSRVISELRSNLLN